MALFTLLMVILLILAMFTEVALGVIIVLFGDIAICVFILTRIFKHLFKKIGKKKNKKKGSV